MKQDASFGIIPLRFMKGKWEIFLVQLRRGHHWGFPKGHPEQGEEPLASALRELKEETQLEVLSLLSKEPLVETYRFTSQGELIEKQVTYFIAQVTGEAALQEEEVENGLWFDLEQALDVLTFPEGKRILVEVIQIVSCHNHEN